MAKRRVACERLVYIDGVGWREYVPRLRPQNHQKSFVYKNTGDTIKPCTKKQMREVYRKTGG